MATERDARVARLSTIVCARSRDDRAIVIRTAALATFRRKLQKPRKNCTKWRVLL
jgi:hypothetical protein